jgi:hypothetical protein
MRREVLLSGEVTLEVACEMIAALRDFQVGAVLRLVQLRGPLLFFPHARRNGDGSWRIPARDVRALLGDGMPYWDRAVSARTFADWCELKSSQTVVRAMKRGELRKVVLLGEWRIPVSEFLRLMSGPVSFFSRGQGRGNGKGKGSMKQGGVVG